MRKNIFILYVDYTNQGKQKKFHTEKIFLTIFPRSSNFKRGQFDLQHNKRIMGKSKNLVTTFFFPSFGFPLLLSLALSFFAFSLLLFFCFSSSSFTLLLPFSFFFLISLSPFLHNRSATFLLHFHSGLCNKLVRHPSSFNIGLLRILLYVENNLTSDIDLVFSYMVNVFE